jgi:hypothetical protein
VKISGELKLKLQTSNHKNMPNSPSQFPKQLWDWNRQALSGNKYHAAENAFINQRPPQGLGV